MPPNLQGLNERNTKHILKESSKMNENEKSGITLDGKITCPCFSNQCIS